MRGQGRRTVLALMASGVMLALGAGSAVAAREHVPLSVVIHYQAHRLIPIL